MLVERRRVGTMYIVTILALISLCFSFQCESETDAMVFDSFEYVINGDNTVSITGYLSESSDVVIPDTIDDLPVVSVSFYHRHDLLYKSLKSVTLPSSVTRLESMAFNGLAALTEIHGLDNIEYVGAGALCDTGIKEAVFSEKLDYLASDALKYSLAERIVIPDNVTFSQTAFSCMYYLKQISLLPTEETRYIVQNGGLYDTQMATLYAVCNAASSTFVIPETVTSIQSQVFSVVGDESFGIMDVYIGENVSEIADDAFTDSYEGRNPILHVVENSPAHAFAIRCGRRYVIIGQGNDISLEERVAGIINSCITEDMSDYQKAKALHDWLCENVTYDDSLTEYSARSALIDGRAVCNGFANAYHILLSQVGIEDHQVPNLAINHVWNVLKIEDTWTYVDCTWDNPYDPSFFCFNSQICYTTHGGLSNSVWGNTDSLNLYQPYLNGHFTGAVDAAVTAVQNELDEGNMIFTITAENAVTEGILLSVLADHVWTSSDVEYKIAMTGQIASQLSDSGNSVTFISNPSIDCIAYVNDTSVTHDYDGEFLISMEAEGIRIDKYIGQNETVVVPATMYGYNVIGIATDAFIDNENIREVSLPCTIKHIGVRAFEGCIRLSTLNIENGVESIGDRAFFNCSHLEAIHLPDTLTYIGEAAFQSSGIKVVSWPSGISEIPVLCFSYSKLVSFSCGSEITEIGQGAFQACADLISFSVPESSLTSIGRQAFFECKSLESIAIPASVIDVGEAAFSGCASLTEVTCNASEEIISYADGVFYTNSWKTIISVLPWVTELNVPDTVLSIAPFAAYAPNYLSQLQTVTMGDNVKLIGERAFCECRNLKTVSFSDNIEDLPDGVLYECNYINSLKLPKRLKTIGEFSIYFRGDYLALPNVTDISPNSIQLWDVKRIILPPSLTEIPYHGFMLSCNPEIWITSPMTIIQDGAFNVGTPVLVCDEESLAWAFAENTGLPHIPFPDQFDLILPSSLTEIGNRAFYEGAFYSVEVPESVNTIGSNAFAACKNLVRISIPESVKAIAEDAFAASPNVIIFCSEGSVAENYANEQGILCITS